MQAQSPFTIYDASAGSGKTYTLVKEYLKILLTSRNHEAFKSILAITFTNKAVSEMKSRVIEMLKQFSNPEHLNHKNEMLVDISKELGMSQKKIKNKSDTILKSILHNYSAFDISTIDGFTHKLIRTFAKDLNLAQNFEVELDTESILNEAVDALISKTGENKLITDALVEFAIEKADDDKSWDLTYDLNHISKRLTYENDRTPLLTYKNKSLTDFKNFKNHLIHNSQIIKDEIIENAKYVLKLLNDNHLEYKDFSSGYLPKHFVNLSNGKFDINFEAKWQLQIEEKALYPSRVIGSKALTIDRIQPEIADKFYETRALVFQFNFFQAILKNITPLSVLNLINIELEKIKEEENIVLISEFNTIVSDEIKNQPTPFIYERLGEKFKYYFIDEFQDTSVSQWENLKPLISNSLEQEHGDNQGSLMLVGDAKQAIYRWRGGRAEQFIDLYNRIKIPFQVEQVKQTLDYNFRSYQEIVNFNNSFFSYLSQVAFRNNDYQKLFNESTQDPKKNEQGYVSIKFLDLENETDSEKAYCNETFKKINECLINGFAFKDICVLVRSNKHAAAVATYLVDNQIPITSSETLLLKNSETVCFLNAALSLLIQPKNEEARIEFLYYIAKKHKVNDTHSFLIRHFKSDIKDMFIQLKRLGVNLNLKVLINLSLFECVESIIRIFNLDKTADAYLQFYLDEVLAFSQKQISDIKSFLSYFETKKDTLSIVLTESLDAVKIMTIHKSKGLEFPVVIFPFASIDIYKESQTKVWFPIEGLYNDFNYALLNYNKSLSTFGEIGESLFQNFKEQQELDAINLLYVALTRPVEQLYIISSLDLTNAGPNKKTYAGLLISYLMEKGLWIDSKTEYSFGLKKRKYTSKESTDIKIIPEFISVDRASHNISIITKSGYLWDTYQAKAIEKGNIIHNILSRIKKVQDVEFAIKESIDLGEISISQSELIERDINKLISHKSLSKYYTNDYLVYNERDLITNNSEILRPDRLVFLNKKDVVIIDYKTGGEKKEHELQLSKYENVIHSMNLNVEKKILVYINEGIEIKEL